MSNISQKLTYLNETKSLIKDGINDLGAELTEENTFRSYKDALDSIYNEYPKVTDSGTDITLENTKKGKITLDKKGQTSQESTSGKQLFDLTKITSSSSFGITATINENTGEIVLNGTSTSTAYLRFDLDNSIPSGTIVSYGANNSLTKNNCYLNLALDGATKQVLQMNTLNAKNENITLDTDINRVYIQVNSDITLNNFVIKPMLNVGNVLEQYEPYTNGPAPNPDYPYPIKKVSGENNVKVENKNLFDYHWFGTSKDILWTFYYNLLGQDDFRAIPIYIGVGNSATFFSNVPKTTPSLLYAINDINQGSPTDSNLNIENSRTIQANSNGYVYLGFVNTRQYYTDVANGTYYIQIELGSTATEYVEHQEQNYPLTLDDLEVYEDGEFMQPSGKNLINEIIPNSGAWTNGIIVSRNNTSRTNYIEIKPNTSYYIQHAMGNHVGFTSWIYDENKTVIDNLLIEGNEDVSGTITTPSNAKYMIINFNSTIISTNLPMINEGSTALPYEPYGTNEWYLKNYYGKVVLDGSEEWYRWSNNTFYITKLTEIRNALSNYYTYNGNATGAGQLNNGEFFIHDNTNNNAVIFKNTNVGDTVNDFITWLSTHNTEVVYPLATPSFTKITSQTLIDELENLKNNAKSYKDVTKITQTNDELPFIFKASGLMKGDE